MNLTKNNFYSRRDASQALAADDTMYKPGTPEQAAIWSSLLHSGGHVMVDAVAGSGKSYTIIEGIKRYLVTFPSNRVLLLAFNSHIKTELKSKINLIGLDIHTYHSYGMSLIKSHAPNGIRVDNNITKRKALEFGFDKREVAGLCRLISMAKQQGQHYDRAGLVNLAQYYSIDVMIPSIHTTSEAQETHWDDITKFLESEYMDAFKLKDSKSREYSISFDDMIYIPALLRLQAKYDLVIVDEAQDTGVGQIKMLQALATDFRGNSGSRLMVCGDPRQAIYGWRGAGTSSMIDISRTVGGQWTVCDLTNTRRCPAIVVELAKQIVPKIQALPDAPSGTVMSFETANKGEKYLYDNIINGQLVLCRTNRPLVSLYIELRRNGETVNIIGKDYGDFLKTLVEKMSAGTVGQLIDRLGWHLVEQTAKIDGNTQMDVVARSGQIQSLQDRVESLQAICSSCRPGDGMDEVIDRIDEMFPRRDDGTAEAIKQNAINLSTVHRSKGLECTAVYILSPELMPHPKVKFDWEREQEFNLAYVAVTRVMSDGDGQSLLVFCGPIPSMFKNAVLPDDHNGSVVAI